MSTKPAMNNSIKLNNGDEQWVKTACLGTGVMLAGEESKDRLYEPKHKKKLVRVLTVVAYVFFVSLAAIMLSLYYIFLWKGNDNQNDVAKARQNYEAQLSGSNCNNREKLFDVPYDPTPIPVVEANTDATPSTPENSDDLKDLPWQTNNNKNFTHQLTEYSKGSPMLQKLLLGKFTD